MILVNSPKKLSGKRGLLLCTDERVGRDVLTILTSFSRPSEFFTRYGKRIPALLIKSEWVEEYGEIESGPCWIEDLLERMIFHMERLDKVVLSC